MNHNGAPARHTSLRPIVRHEIVNNLNAVINYRVAAQHWQPVSIQQPIWHDYERTRELENQLLTSDRPVETIRKCSSELSTARRFESSQ